MMTSSRHEVAAQMECLCKHWCCASVATLGYFIATFYRDHAIELRCWKVDNFMCSDDGNDQMHLLHIET
jgi:hypothetical protein